MEAGAGRALLAALAGDVTATDHEATAAVVGLHYLIEQLVGLLQAEQHAFAAAGVECSAAGSVTQRLLAAAAGLLHCLRLQLYCWSRWWLAARSWLLLLRGECVVGGGI